MTDTAEGIEDPAQLGVVPVKTLPTTNAAAAMLAGVLNAKQEQERPKRPSALHKLRLLGDPALTSSCEALKPGAKVVAELSDSMRTEINTSRYGLPPGLAITANQLGVLARFCVARKDGEIITMINPTILCTHGDPEYISEGCLSIPGYRIPMLRYTKLTVRYLDEHWNVQQVVAEKQFAQIVQHELDHMNGKLIIDSATRQQRRSAQRFVVDALRRGP